jgi:lysophospholipase L1-like esterase
VSGSGILCPPACTQRFPRPSRYLVNFGHSDATPYGAATPAQSWPALLAADLSAKEVGLAVVGANASYPDGTKFDGGWPWVLGYTQPGTNLAAPAPPFTGSLFYGFNDLVNLAGPDNLGPFAQAMTTMIARLDSVAVFGDDSRTVSAPGSGWQAVASQGESSSRHLLGPEHAGSSLTIAVPESFRGGTIALGFTSASYTNPPSGQAVYAVSVDGGSGRRYTIDGPSMVTPTVGAGGGAIGTVDQIAALAPGAHTLTVTLLQSSPSIASYFDYWEAEASQPQARPILLPLQYQVPDAAFAPFAENRYVPTDAAIVALDGVIRLLASRWGPNVIAVPLDLGLDPANYDTDGAHPSTAGHALIARQMLAALSTVTLTATPQRGSTFKGWSGAGCSGTRPCTIALSRGRTVTARFARPGL